MPSPSALPIEAREHAWRLLWERLLQPVPDPEPAESDDRDEDDEETAA